VNVVAVHWRLRKGELPSKTKEKKVQHIMFFSFDGLDGAGKSTQMHRFCEWLTEQKYDVLLCRDPGSTPLGEKLREILLERNGVAIARTSEMFLYMAARAQLVAEVIEPALAAGKVVVCDRFLLANVVYQGHAGGIPMSEIYAAGRTATNKRYPDLTFVFDVPLSVALQRMNRELDRMESQGNDFLQKVREGFLVEAKNYPARVEVVNATQNIDDIFQQVCASARTVLARG
jgi:dTMP kinase